MIHLICVGKLKEKNILDLENDYLKRLRRFKLKIHEVKSQNDNTQLEAQAVAKKIQSLSPDKSPYLITLEEKGKEYNSSDFAKHCDTLSQVHGTLVFLIGGAAGHGEEILNLKNEAISLGKMTFPHKLARLLLVEQVYRAQTICEGHPYHK